MASLSSGLPPRSWKVEGSFSFTFTDDHLGSLPGTLNGAGTRQRSTSGTTMSTVTKVKSPSPTASTSQGVDEAVGFSFLNVVHPNDAKRSSNKRAIRSHVAKVQHSKTRASNSANKQSAKNRNQNRALVPRVKAEPESQTALSATRKSSSSDDQDGIIDIVRPRHDSGGGNVDKNQPLTFPILSYMVHTFQGGRHDPFWTYPVPFHPHMERIVDHYIVDVLIDVPFVVPPDQPGLLQREWMPVCMGEPATFRAMALMGASHYSVANPSFKNKFDLLALRGKAIADINEALTDPVRARSDSIMAAVLKLASWEAVFGDAAHFHAHMHGLQQMVRLRGGMSRLGMNGLLERSLLWIDSNASHHLKCAVKFPRAHFPSRFAHPIPQAVAATIMDQPICSTYEMAANPPAAMEALRIEEVA